MNLVAKIHHRAYISKLHCVCLDSTADLCYFTAQMRSQERIKPEFWFTWKGRMYLGDISHNPPPASLYKWPQILLLYANYSELELFKNEHLHNVQS